MKNGKKVQKENYFKKEKNYEKSSQKRDKKVKSKKEKNFFFLKKDKN